VVGRLVRLVRLSLSSMRWERGVNLSGSFARLQISMAYTSYIP
jgi:hypothetical protein